MCESERARNVVGAPPLARRSTKRTPMGTGMTPAHGPGPAETPFPRIAALTFRWHRRACDPASRQPCSGSVGLDSQDYPYQ